jgi:hypothetical protein
VKILLKKDYIICDLAKLTGKGIGTEQRLKKDLME